MLSILICGRNPYDFILQTLAIQSSPCHCPVDCRAGFYFLGERDRVKCWYCNGGLQNWEPLDELWSEHAKWFPTYVFRRILNKECTVRIVFYSKKSLFCILSLFFHRMKSACKVKSLAVCENFLGLIMSEFLW